MKHNRQELLTYALLWGILFLAPLLSFFLSSSRGSDFSVDWAEVLHVWRQFALFLVVFLIHNFLLAPLLLVRQRRWLYFSLVAVLLAAFVAVQCSQRPDDIGRPLAEQRGDHRPPHHMDGHEPQGPPDFDDRMPPPDMHSHEADGNHRPDEVHPPLLMGQRDLIATVILILMLGMNVGVKLYYRQRHDQRKLAELERQSLEQQLEYLKYQINPHFLMNTLNNIHALVDIDAERAKESIVELSKIMRFVLYEGSKQTVPLGRELAFTQDYIQLMRMRVTDRVRITVEMPERVPDSQIPPLMLITFVENAFKHGVSYRQESFIDISVAIEGRRLRFTCRNSRVPQDEDRHGGVGLQNVKRRLELIYGRDYALNIDEQPTEYNIELVLPL